MPQHYSYNERWHPSQVEECVAMWELTEEETTKLMQFQKAVSDVDHWKNNPFDLVRFLLTPMCHGNVKTMAQCFRNSIQMRQHYQVDTIFQDYSPPILYNYSPIAVIQGHDKEGDNILVGRLGAIDNLGLLHRFGRDEAIKTALWYYELEARGPWLKDEARRPRMFLVVHDLKGLNRHHLHPAVVSLAREIMHIETTMYPHGGKKLLLVNCPPLLTLAWAIFKHIIPAHVKEILEFASEGEHTEQLLSQHVDVSLLPKEVVPGKGKGKAVRGYEPIWAGGKLPPPSDDDWKRRDPATIFDDINAGDEDDEEEEIEDTRTPSRDELFTNKRRKIFSRVLLKGSWMNEEDYDAPSGKPLVMVDSTV